MMNRAYCTEAQKYVNVLDRLGAPVSLTLEERIMMSKPRSPETSSHGSGASVPLRAKGIVKQLETCIYAHSSNKSKSISALKELMMC